MEKKFIRLFLVIILFLSFFVVKDNVCCGAIKGINEHSLNYKKMAKDFIESGCGKNVINTMLDNGIFGDEVTTHDYKGFEIKFRKSFNLSFASEAIGYRNPTSYMSSYNEADSYYKTVFDVYKGVVAELKEVPEMEWYFNRAARYAGSGDNNYAENVIEAVAIEIVNQKVLEIQKVYNLGCSGRYTSNVTKFEYGGKSYVCSDVYHEYTMYGRTSGPREFYEEFGLYMSAMADANIYTTSMNVSDNTRKRVLEDKYYRASEYGTGEPAEEGEISFNVNDAGYIPNLVNAVGFSKRLAEKGELKALTNPGNETSFGGILKTSVDEFSKYGTFAMYAIIILMGVRMIWSGINGRVQFIETLPYVAVAIILFYAAPGTIRLLQQVLNVSDDIETQIKSVFGLVVNIVRVLAFCGIIYNGIKIISTSAIQRAKLKASIIPIFVGCIIVFAASFVVDFTLKISKDVGIEPSSNIESIADK